MEKEKIIDLTSLRIPNFSGVRIDNETWEAFIKDCKENERNYASEIRFILKNYFKIKEEIKK